MSSENKIDVLYEQLAGYMGRPLKFFDLNEIPFREIAAPECVNDPVVSVAMLCYNHAPYLAAAIEGVVKQQCDFAFELVIGEDCSTDNSRAVILEYQKRYPDKIRLICSDSNVGMIANNLRLLAHCRGKYVAFCEGDDLWTDQNKLAIQYAVMKSHPQLSLVFSRSDVVSANWRKCGQIMFSGFPPRRLVWQEILDGRYFLHTATVMGRNRFLQEIIRTCPEIRCNLSPAADTMIFLGLATRGDVAFLNRSLSSYRILETSASHHLTLEREWSYKCRLIIFALILAERYRQKIGYESKKLKNSWKNIERDFYKKMICTGDYGALPSIDRLNTQLHLQLPLELRLIRSLILRRNRFACRMWLLKEKLMALPSIPGKLFCRCSVLVAPALQIHKSAGANGADDSH